MPRNAASAIENTFVGGFVTQATALNFPQNAAFEVDNVVFSETSIVSRRNGFDYENNFVKTTLSRTEKVQVSYLWKNASGDGNTNLVVQQNGDTLLFYDTGNQLSLSGGKLASTLSLSSFQASGSTSDNLNQNECQFSTGLGYLFVVHPYCDPFYVQYSAGSFTTSIITFTIRDINGIPENVLVDNRPSSLTDTHKYNLFNQGWDTAKIGTMHTALSTTYPSNADVWWTFKDSTDIFNPGTMLASVTSGSTPAPKGYYRLNPWNTSRAAIALAQSGLTLTLSNVDQTSGTVRPSVTEFHSGRVWYGGVNAQGYTSNLYFTRIVQGVSDFGYCATTNDPTAQDNNDFLPSDGGIISIPQAGTIYRLISLGSSLLVFGANGVWAITGSVGVGFTATDFSVNFIGLTRSISGTSFVVVDNSVLWWNSTAINILQNDPQQGLVIQSMTDKTIKDYYLGLSIASKRFARGAYNPRTHTVEWLFRSQEFASLTETYTYDSVLVFNTLVQAWYTWSLPSSPTPVSIVVVEGSGSLTSQDTIVDNTATTVVDNLGNALVTYGFSRTTSTTVTKYLTHNGTAFTFAECFNVDYKDWVQEDSVGQDYTSFFVTGQTVKTQGQRRFQTNYIYIFSDISDGVSNSYDLRTLWNFSNSKDSGEWTQKQRVLHDTGTTDAHFDTGRRKLKVRGAGLAVQYKISSVSGKPFNIIGWSTYDTANQNV